MVMCQSSLCRVEHRILQSATVLMTHLQLVYNLLRSIHVNSGLRTDSPLSNARERRRAKRSGGKESGEDAPRKLLSRLAAMPCVLVLQREPAHLYMYSM